eukprot:105499_1
MAASYLCLAAILIIFRTNSDYYFSLNALSRENANTFCQNHCQSNLASIHSYTDRFEIETLLQKTATQIDIENVWIGLYEQSNSAFWSDSSEFDWGADLIIPKDNSDPKYYELMYDNSQNTFYFNQADISIEQPFICNKCEWNVLSKYVHINKQLDMLSAQLECNTRLSTSLASIHSVSDNNEATLLSGLGSHRNGTYIGMKHNQWIDDTMFNYNTAMHNINDENCTILNPVHNAWMSTDCSNQYDILCNAPTVLCDINQWTGDLETFEWIFADSGDCGVYNNNTHQTTTTNQIKTFVNIDQKSWSTLTVEYTWKIDTHSPITNTGIAYSGISISFDGSNLTT